MQLMAGCTGSAYNARKQRRGAFWEDFYHATVVDTEEHLARCFTYIDLNMVRAGVVDHPSQWPHCGYYEIQNPPQRYRIIDRSALAQLLAVEEDQLAKVQKLLTGGFEREPQWSAGVAVGRRSFVDAVKGELGYRGRCRPIEKCDGGWILREGAAAYGADTGARMAPLSRG